MPAQRDENLLAIKRGLQRNRHRRLWAWTEGRPPSRTDTVDASPIVRLMDEGLPAAVPSLLSEAPPAAAETALPPTPVEPTGELLRGEYGANRQAVRRGARELRRFTCPSLAAHIHLTRPQTSIA